MNKFLSVIAIMSAIVTTAKASVEEFVNVSEFEQIQISGSVNVVYTQSDKQSVKIKGSKEGIKNIRTEVKGNTLYVSQIGNNNITGLKDFMKAIWEGRKNDEEVIVYVSSPDLVSVKLTGSGDFDAKGKVDTDNMDIAITGSGDIDFESLICDNCSVTVTGSGEADIDLLESITTTVNLRGSGDVKINQQRVRKTTLNVYGSGDIDIDCKKCGEIDAFISGSGDITLHGEYAKCNGNVRGSGNINKR